MILFPNCKINIGLTVVAKREDGFHDIETVMFPVRGLCDSVEIIRSEGYGVEFSQSGNEIKAAPCENLCIMAYKAVEERFGIDGVKMHLHKTVPMGAGLGGGSADAAYVVKGLNELFELGMKCEDMEAICAGLGSDVAFFVGGKPAFCTGRGEIMSPVSVDLKGYRLVIVMSGIEVSTAEAYRGVVPGVSHGLPGLISEDISTWREGVVNDFEESVFRKHPQLRRIKSTLYEAGALYASMSGSGSAVYGIFKGEPSLPEFPREYIVYQEVM